MERNRLFSEKKRGEKKGEAASILYWLYRRDKLYLLLVCKCVRREEKRRKRGNPLLKSLRKEGGKRKKARFVLETNR